MAPTWCMHTCNRPYAFEIACMDSWIGPRQLQRVVYKLFAMTSSQPGQESRWLLPWSVANLRESCSYCNRTGTASREASGRGLGDGDSHRRQCWRADERSWTWISIGPQPRRRRRTQPARQEHAFPIWDGSDVDGQVSGRGLRRAPDRGLSDSDGRSRPGRSLLSDSSACVLRGSLFIQYTLLITATCLVISGNADVSSYN